MTAPMTREELLAKLWSDINALGGRSDQDNSYDQGIVDTIAKVLGIIEAAQVVPGVAQTAATGSTLTFGTLVENIAASDRNPIKRGIFMRKTGAKMAEYATKEGCHSTPLDNLRASNQGASK